MDFYENCTNYCHDQFDDEIEEFFILPSFHHMDIARGNLSIFFPILLNPYTI
jgi:hypothetical protein